MPMRGKSLTCRTVTLHFQAVSDRQRPGSETRLMTVGHATESRRLTAHQHGRAMYERVVLYESKKGVAQST